MKKILLGTSAILGALTLVASSANAQTASMMKDQKAGMKASIGGTVSAVVSGSNTGTVLTLPSWRNYISVKADGQASSLNMTYGAYLRYRPFDGANGADKAYVYLGQKYFGTLTAGRDNSSLSNNLISPTDLVPGYSVDGDANPGGGYVSAYDITGRAKALGFSYVTPTLYGVKLGYTYSTKASTANFAAGQSPATNSYNGNLAQSSDFFARYDGAFGPVTLAVMAGGRLAKDAHSQDVGAWTAGAQLGYTDGKNIGINVNGNYMQTKTVSGNTGNIKGWGVGMSFDTPRVAGLTLGMLIGSADVDSVTNYNFGIGLGYAWSENFSQTIGYDQAFGGNAPNNGYAWTIASQVSF